MVGVSILPLLIILASLAGVIVLTLGIRGKPTFSMPRCAKCSYDLRALPFMNPEQLGACPECGSDLSAEGAVSFGKWQRSPKRMVLGIVLILLPWLLLVPLLYFVRSRGNAAVAIGTGSTLPNASTPTATMLANLPTNVDAPWIWQELERRQRAGTLSAQDAGAAINVLINDLNKKHASGRPIGPLSWSGGFVSLVQKTGAIPTTQSAALTQAFYTTSPIITAKQNARQGDAMMITCQISHPWDLSGQKLVWCLTGIDADTGEKLSPQPAYDNQRSKSPDQFSGTSNDSYLQMKLPQSLPVGAHELTFNFEFGTVSDTAVMRGIDGKPGTPDKWPSPIARWQGTVKKTITVVSKDQPVIAIVTDPAQDPFIACKIGIAEALARPSARGVEIAVKWKTEGKPSIPLAYKIEVQAGTQKVNLGPFNWAAFNDGTMQGMGERGTVKSLPADVTSIDIKLTPDPKLAEQYPQINTIWGGPYEIKNVPLQRFDLDQPATQGSR